jgi:septal ring-binding cell division protein DamX
MKNLQLLIITSFFSSLLFGCGMKGPLYRTAKEPAPVSEDGNQTLTELQPAKEIAFNDIQDKLQADALSESETGTIETEKQEQDAPSGLSEQPQETDRQSSLFTQTAQLLAVNPSHFTLQLAAMTSQESLQQFAIKHNLPQKEVYIYQRTDNSKAKYVVIYGEYKNKQAAETASEQLPGSFANMDTWIRKYKLIHQELLLNQQ